MASRGDEKVLLGLAALHGLACQDALAVAEAAVGSGCRSDHDRVLQRRGLALDGRGRHRVGVDTVRSVDVAGLARELLGNSGVLDQLDEFQEQCSFLVGEILHLALAGALLLRLRAHHLQQLRWTGFRLGGALSMDLLF